MIKIDIDTRCWQIPREEAFLGVESDDKVKILQFELSKNEFCDGLNFTDCNCFINYKNNGNDTISYGITDMVVQEDGTVTFTWEVSRGATIYKGNTFAILCAKKVHDDGTIMNEWNSRIGSFTVSKGLEPSSSIVEVPEIDIISQLLSVAKQANANAQNNIEQSNSLLEKAEGLGYLKEEYDVLEARMNQFTSLKEGSTTGDAELQDIRVGADGKTYDTAGDAVRGQIGELKGDLADCRLSESNLYTEVIDNFDYGDFTIGKPNNPSESINTSVTYVGTIYANIKKGMVVKSLSTDYDYTVAKVSDNYFGEWKAKGNDTVIEEDDRYVICARSNIYAPFSTVVQDVKINFKIQSIYHTLKYVDEYRFNVKEYGAVGDGITNDSNIIQGLLNKANTDGNVCVYFPKGTYYIGTTLLYYPNTAIIMHPEAIILRDEKVSPILTNYSICGDDVPCYSNGYLRIKGGTFKGVYPSGDTVYRLIGLQCGKLSELTIENVSFIDACAGNHLIDISGCNNVTIRHNKIMGMHLQQSLRPTTPNGDDPHVASLEMIQLDVGEGLGVGTNPPYDLIPSKNIIIEDNEFMANPDNEESVIYRPIGIHMNPYKGYYYENVRINDNTFNDVLGRCIGVSGVRQIEIRRNTFDGELTMIDSIIKLSLFMGTLSRDSDNIDISDNVTDLSSDLYHFFEIYSGGMTEPFVSRLNMVRNVAHNLDIHLENTKKAYLLFNDVSNVDHSVRCENIIVHDTNKQTYTLTNPLQGKKIGALGDSLTYGHTLGTDKVWLAKIAERNEMIDYNYGQNGNPLASTENVQGMVERYTSMADGLHYIIVEGGANDMNEGIPIGTNTDTSIYTFKGAINTLIDGLRAKYPTAHICFMTNWKRGYSGELAYVEAMKEVCALKGIPCKDNYHTSGIDFTDTNQSQYFDLGIVDGGSANKHFSEAGNEFISWGIEAFLKSC